MDDMLAAGLLEELRDFHRRYNQQKVAENRWVRPQLPLLPVPPPCLGRFAAASSSPWPSLPILSPGLAKQQPPAGARLWIYLSWASSRPELGGTQGSRLFLEG